jgi:hypothetical protein
MLFGALSEGGTARIVVEGEDVKLVVASNREPPTTTDVAR